MAAWTGWEFGGKCIHVYVCLSPFAVHLKLPWHCLLIGYVKSESVSCSVVSDYGQAPLSMDFFLQARILEWVAIPFSRGSFWPRDWTRVSCIAGALFTVWATRENLISYTSVQDNLKKKKFKLVDKCEGLRIALGWKGQIRQNSSVNQAARLEKAEKSETKEELFSNQAVEKGTRKWRKILMK